MKSLEALRRPGPSALPRAGSGRIGSTGPVTGADLLLLAAEQVPSETKMRILAVGACADDAYGELLQRLAHGLAERVPPADNSRPRHAWGYPR